MKDVLVVGMMRSPIGTGTAKSLLKSLTPQNLSLQVLSALFRQTKVPPEKIEIFRAGSVVSLKSNDIGQAPSREIALRAGMVNASANIAEKACSSGLLAIAEAARAIKYDGAELAIGGGVDMMSNVPEEVNAKALTDPLTGKTMPELSDLKSRELGFTRRDYDIYAMESYERAKRHQFDYLPFWTDIIVPGNILTFDQNIALREVTWEWMQNPSQKFLLPGCEITTFGNSSKKGDAASYLLLASPRVAKKYGLRPLARIKSYAEHSGSDPKNFIVKPVCAIRKALDTTELSFSKIGAFWVNEAFPGSPLNFMKSGVSWEIVNPCGGAIAFGHALGATGAVLPLNAIVHARLNKIRYVVVSLCNAIDEATAMVLEIL